MKSEAFKLLPLFTKAKKTLSFAESCSGGLLAKTVVEVPDASHFFLGSIVAYSNDSKEKLLGVKSKTLHSFGAVSLETAQEMAFGAKNSFNSDVALAITGIAGPSGGSKEKPVGSVAFAIVGKEVLASWIDHFSGTREEIMQKSVEKALNKLVSLDINSL